MRDVLLPVVHRVDEQLGWECSTLGKLQEERWLGWQSADPCTPGLRQLPGASSGGTQNILHMEKTTQGPECLSI